MGKKENKRQKSLQYLVLSAMLTALSVVVLYIGALLDILSLTAVAVASLFLLFAVREMPLLYRLFIYGGTSLLAALLLPTPEAALLYAMFGGLYPLLKFIIERRPRPLAICFKLLLLNAVVTVAELCSVFLFQLPPMAWYLLLALYLLANPAFFLYDKLLDRLLVLYEVRLRPHLGRFL